MKIPLPSTRTSMGWYTSRSVKSAPRIFGRSGGGDSTRPVPRRFRRLRLRKSRRASADQHAAPLWLRVTVAVMIAIIGGCILHQAIGSLQA